MPKRQQKSQSKPGPASSKRKRSSGPVDTAQDVSPVLSTAGTAQPTISLPPESVNNVLSNEQLQAMTMTIAESVRKSVMTSLEQQGIFARHSATTTATSEVGTNQNNTSRVIPQTPSTQNMCNDSEAVTAPDTYQQSTALDGHDLSHFNLAGGSQGNGNLAFNLNSPTSVPLSCRPLHCKVPVKVKEKIWAGEFIELGSLHNDQSEGDFTFKLDKNGVIGIVPSTKKQFLTIEKWTDAFNIYASVRRIKFPQEMESLATYQNVIRSISNAHGDWYYYDVNFRKLRQGGLQISWNTLEHELYAIALSRRRGDKSGGPSNSNSQGRPFRGRQTPGQGTCHKYNNGSACNGCRYRHACSYCGLSHPKAKCFKAQGGSQQSDKPRASQTGHGDKGKQQPYGKS